MDDIFNVLNFLNKPLSRILYSEKKSFKNEYETKKLVKKLKSWKYLFPENLH